MCIDVRKNCECGTSVQFHLRDNVLLPEVITGVFCPACQDRCQGDGDCTLDDNGWKIEYDMALARMLVVQKLTIDPEDVGPEFLFDQGYACWQEMYPGEREEIRQEKEKIVRLLKEDQQKYLKTIQAWNIERINRLKEAGWRKARLA